METPQICTPKRLSGIRIRDPFIFEPAAGSYVLFGTTDENVWGGPATGFDCYTSDDLESWSGPIEAFRPPEGFWSESQFWAPEVYAHGGRFYMFATTAAERRARPPVNHRSRTGKCMPSGFPMTSRQSSVTHSSSSGPRPRHGAAPCSSDDVEPPAALRLAKDPLFTDGHF
jgi:hypothetical protein